jgi:hypothetical protein
MAANTAAGAFDFRIITVIMIIFHLHVWRLWVTSKQQAASSHVPRPT